MNHLFSHEFNISPILCSLSPSLLEMVPGHRGLPGPHAAPPAGSASRCGSDPAATPPHATGAGSALDRAGRKGRTWHWWCGLISVVVMSAAGSGGWECGLSCWAQCTKRKQSQSLGGLWLFTCMDTLFHWACEHQTLQSCPNSHAEPFRPSQVFLSHTEGWPPSRRQKLCLLLAL